MTHDLKGVLAAARIAFPENQLGKVLAALSEYGAEPHECEVERVQLAILEISGGSKKKLLRFVKAAKVDYRDVLAWQQLGVLPSNEGKKLQAAARALIKNGDKG